MAVKGSVVKQSITEKILETFPGSFLYNDGKEIRINGTENGELVQIKVTLTASKTPVGIDDSADAADGVTPVASSTDETKVPSEPSDDEKQRLQSLLSRLGL